MPSSGGLESFLAGEGGGLRTVAPFPGRLMNKKELIFLSAMLLRELM